MSGQSRRRGPVGGLLGLVGQGVGMAAEYREHRKQQNQARSASQQQQQQEEEFCGEPSDRHRTTHPVQDDPPAYNDIAGPSERSLEAGQPASAEKSGNRELRDEDLTDDDSDSLDTASIEEDEEDWELDDFQDPIDSQGLPSYEQSEALQENETVDDLVREVMASTKRSKASSDEITASDRPLPCPVIIPQRRPRTKARGFVRAYSPVLENCGIDQATFMKFLKNFHKSSQQSPIFPALAISARIAGLAPSVIATAVCAAVEVGARVGGEIQTRTRMNGFLDTMNKELFQPAGLYAMIFKYKSDAEMERTASAGGGLLSSLIRTEQVDLSTTQSIAKYGKGLSSEPQQSSTATMSDRMKALRVASGATRGTANFPMAAPLVFPEIDYKLDHEGPETWKDKAKDAKGFLNDYMDRRAQMEYEAQDPSSKLAVPTSQHAFKSPLADPNHPMYSGGLVTLASGGKLTPRLERRERRRETHLLRDTRRIERGREPRHERRRARRYDDEYHDELSARTGRGRGGLLGGALRAIASSRGRGSASIATSCASSSQEYEDMYGATPELIGGNSGRDQDPLGEHIGRSRRRGRRQRGGRRGGMVRRVLREDVLYLMVVNMPSEEELAEARRELARAN
ncbi:Hypothetical predicted protein [Lecanosticta acicola]|uniref:Uncharacterized protein n=1 Tax=Lecanosticta acicola TaxID=111012 RepID=A0AAI8Z3A6_9PEZI|nr:Hypothetical predicted protein [Lecanosticta acicola]